MLPRNPNATTATYWLGVTVFKSAENGITAIKYQALKEDYTERRFIMVAPPRGALVLGEHYLSVKCAHCGAVVPIAPNPGRRKVLHGPGKLRVGCPFCGWSADYPATEMKTRVLKVLPPEAH